MSSFLRLWNFPHVVTLGHRLSLGSERALLLPMGPVPSAWEAAAGHYSSVWQAHGFEETHATFLQTDLLKLLVKKCSKGTGFSKTWLLRDLEVWVRCLRQASHLGATPAVATTGSTLSSPVLGRHWNRVLGLRPLLETGILQLTSPSGRGCICCLLREHGRTNSLWKHAADRYLTVIKCVLELLFPFDTPY